MVTFHPDAPGGIRPGRDTEQRRQIETYLAAGQLRVRCSAEDAEVLNVARERLGQGLSFADVSVLLLAQYLGVGAVLATGDALLRKTAEREKLKACGILGLFDQMVHPARPGSRPALPASVAASKLELLLQHPECRLPREKCMQKIKSWTGNTWRRRRQASASFPV
ncbi:MAG: hypothetical protein HZA92_05395 [Verrucomicrobia bacterium]|nr:hypothetical protein [Verrucomicrobiota bacterium]